MSFFDEAAEQLVTEWAERAPSLHGPYELALVEWVLLKLADPSSGYGLALEDICRRRCADLWDFELYQRVWQVLP